MELNAGLKSKYDVAIVGGGHNAPIAAKKLAEAGLSVLILEKNAHVGGAAVSEKIFSDFDARLSRYSYLLSMFPRQFIADLGLRFATRRRRIGSFTPYSRDGEHRGLLVSNESQVVTEASFRELTGGKAEFKAYLELLGLEQALAKVVWPTMFEPLMHRDAMRKLCRTEEAKAAWAAFIELPFGEYLERFFENDLVRGMLFTDAKIGISTYPHDPTYLQNRTFLYHVIGNETGEWSVPVGGMGALTSELYRVAREAGTEVKTQATVTRIFPADVMSSLYFFDEEAQRTYEIYTKYILVNASPTALEKMMGIDDPRKSAAPGSVFKMNMLLARAPRMRDKRHTFADAFTGTFHFNEGYSQMLESYRATALGNLPALLPGEVYCHTQTDRSILSPELDKAGYETLTLFGIDLPYPLFREDNEAMKKLVTQKFLDALNEHLAEPIQECLAVDARGNPCLEAKSPVDLEEELGMSTGNIFHEPLSWPFVENSSEVGMWGVETRYHPNILMAGSGIRRGGCVSGFPGYYAAQAVLERKNPRRKW